MINIITFIIRCIVNLCKCFFKMEIKSHYLFPSNFISLFDSFYTNAKMRNTVLQFQVDFRKHQTSSGPSTWYQKWGIQNAGTNKRAKVIIKNFITLQKSGGAMDPPAPRCRRPWTRFVFAACSQPSYHIRTYHQRTGDWKYFWQ